MLSHLVPKIVEAARSALAQVSRPLEQSDKFQPGISPSGRSSGFHRPSSQGTISDGQSINSSPSINIPVPSLTPLWSPSGSVSASLPTPEDGYISRSLGSYLPFRYGSSKLRQSIVPGESSSLEDSDSLVQQFSKSLESATSFPSQFGSSRRGSSQINNHLLPPSMYHPMESHQRSAPAPLVSSDIGKSPTQLWPHRVSRLTAPGSPLLSDESELAHSGPSSMGNSSGTSEESFHLLTDVRSPPPHGRVNRSLAIHTVPSMVTQTLKKSAKAKASGVITTTNARPVAMPFSGNALPDSDFPSQMESYYRPDYWEAQHDSMVPSSVNQGLSAPVSTADHGSESNQPFVALSGSKLSDFEYSTEGDDVDGYDFADDSTEDDTDEEYADDEDEDIFLEGLPNKVRIKSGGHMIHKARHQQAREIPFPRLCGGVFCGPNRLVCFYAALYTKENFPNSIASPPVQGTYPVVIPPLQSRVNATLATRASHSSAGGTSTLTTPASDATPSMSCTVMPTPTIMELIAHPVEGQRSSVIPATPLFSSKLGHVYATEGTSVATPLNPTSVYLAPPDPLASASYASLFQLRFLRFHLDMEHFKSYDQLSELRSKSQQRYYFSHQDRESYISDRLDDLPMFSSATMSSRTRRLSPVRSDIPSSDESSAITHPHSPRSIRPLKTGLQRSETLTEDEEPSNNTESGLIVYPSGSGHGRTPVAASYEARDRTVRRIGRQPRSGPSGVGPQATSSESLADSSTRSVPDRGGDQGMYSSWDNFVAEGDDEDEAGTALYSDADDDSSNEKDFLSLPTLYVRPKTTRTSPEIIENPKRSPFFPDMGAQVGVALATERKRWDTGGLGSQSGELDLGNYIYVAQVDTLSPVDYDLAHTYQIYGHDPVALARANAGAAALHNRPDLVQTWTLVMHLLTNYSPYFHQVNAAFHPYVDPFSPLFAPSLVMSCFSVPMRTPAAPTAKVSNKPTELPTSAGHRASNWGPLAGEQSWLTMLPGDPTMPQAVQWGAHPLGRHLVDHLFYYYEALHDIQTLCMLVCILHQPFPPTPAWMFLNDRRTWINSYQRAYGRPMVYSSGSHKTSSLYTPVPAELVALARPLSDTLSRFATGSNPSNGAPMALALPPPMTVPAFASIIQSPSGLTTPLSNPSMGATDYFGAHWVPPNSTSTGIGHSATGGTTVSESGSGSMERGDRLFEGSVPPVGVPEVMAGQLLHAPSTGASSGPLAIRPGEVNAAFMAPTQLAENRSSPQLPNGIISHYHPLVVNLAGYSYQGGPINSSPKRSWIYPPIGPTLPSSSLPRTSSVSFSPQWGYTSSPTKAGSGSTVQRTSGSSQPPISAGPFTSHFGNLPFIYANNTNPDVLGEEGDALSDRQTPIPAVGSFPNRGFVSHTNQDESLSPTTPTQPGSGNHKPLGEAGSSVTTTSRFFNWLKPGPGHRSLSQDLSASKKGVDGRTPFELMNETHSTISRNPSLPSAEESRLGKGDQSQGKRTEVRNGNFRRRIPNREANEFIALFNVEDQRKQLEHNPVSLAPTSWSLATAMDDEFDNDYNPHWQPLLNPQRAALYDHYRLLYADILGRWGFQQARCEVLKFVETPKLQRLVHETMTYQLQFTVDRAEARGQTTDFPPLFTMHAKDSIICAVCRQMVKGSSLFCWCCGHAGHADHFQAWFDKDPDRSCPAGCGCQCYTVALGQLCPPERGRSWTRETSRPVDAPQAPAVGLVDVSKKPSLTTANSGDALTMAEPLRDDTRSGTTANHSTGDHRSRLTKGKEPASQCMPDSPVNPADLAMPLDLRYHHNF
ncbi:GATOR complex protein wdr59 [Dispira simplex]|nr:GATOR complex protein wdr59 [Dispira simplex]